jgi:hypothetical protein
MMFHLRLGDRGKSRAAPGTSEFPDQGHGAFDLFIADSEQAAFVDHGDYAFGSRRFRRKTLMEKRFPE